ncbi:MAG: PorV/PorQ family protein [Bacteroidales bacterium]|nr:PorV/PorQ family protein [Bacteroidales bacterium]
MKKSALILLQLVLPLVMNAQALPLLYNPTDTRSLALGGVSSALEAGPWAVDANLAAAPLDSTVFSAGASFVRWAPKPTPDSRVALGGWYHYDDWAFGLSAKGSFQPAYNQVSAVGETLDSFTPYDFSVAIGAAWSPAPQFALSATARLVSSALAEGAVGTTACADLGAAWSDGTFRVAATVANLGGKLRYGQTEESLPALVRTGFSYSHELFTLALEGDYLMKAGLMAGAGAEFRPAAWVALRAGYHYGPENRGLPSFASCGIGLNFNGVALDLSVLLASPTLGGSFGAGLSYSF